MGNLYNSELILDDIHAEVFVLSLWTSSAALDVDVVSIFLTSGETANVSKNEVTCVHTCGCEYMVLISDRFFALVKKLWWIATNCSATILKLGSAVEDLGMNQSRIKS